MKADEKQNWALVSPSGVAFHFGTSGLSVAVATAVTHPLGNLSKLRVNKFTVSLSQLPICLFASCNLYNLSGLAWLNRIGNATLKTSFRLVYRSKDLKFVSILGCRCSQS